MYTTSLRKVGGSLMLSVPPAILDLLHLEAGQTLGIAVEGEKLVLERTKRRSYTLQDLLSQCDPAAAFPVEDREWLEDGPVGLELL